MTVITEHRQIGFSIGTISEERWRWTLHPPKRGSYDGIVKSREVFGTHEDATAAAKAAIDSLLDGKNSN